MPEMDIKQADSRRTAGKAAEALKILDNASPADKGSAIWHYTRGRVMEDMGQYDDAVTEYETAIQIDPDYRAARFRLGYLSDLRGDEEKAVQAYEFCVNAWPRDVAALLNLGTIYEERGYARPEYYDKAIKMYQRVLEMDPNNSRALLATRDAQAAKVMFYDEEQERRRDKRNQVMEIPVTDFELSVRSRNCLKKMNIRTLGDLVMHTDKDLLSYKNFGETSLSEIKEMLTSKGLYLGMGLEQQSKKAPGLMLTPVKPVEAVVVPAAVAPASEAASMPLESIEFSVRSRKCFQRLGIMTLGDLANHSEAEMLGIKNFGQTSLNEVKQKLRRYGLSLKES